MKKKAAKAASIASLTLFMLTGAGSVAQATPIHGGSAVTDGPEVQSCDPADGGTWCHGTSGAWPPGWQNCFSNYINNEFWHSASVAMGGGTNKKYAAPGYWANANVVGGIALVCNSFWDNRVDPPPPSGS
ncbi:lactococcin 972 family bacteriocin [Herbihabitans rhizosphaerae]|uniref:lactococcin 972 family bacteriocin n=1 Tax=Herbihabitans rhizosphaerae TaxID=1872711 RepID=UPI0013EE8303|nr:lactococcin 972 family bacteriocin [Herbihabitans rhizosphaerae]